MNYLSRFSAAYLSIFKFKLLLKLTYWNIRNHLEPPKISPNHPQTLKTSQSNPKLFPLKPSAITLNDSPLLKQPDPSENPQIQSRTKHLKKTAENKRENGFSLTHFLQYSDRIVDSVLIRRKRVSEGLYFCMFHSVRIQRSGKIASD